jgi:predicted acyltransferase
MAIALGPGSPYATHRDRLRFGILYGLALGLAAHLFHAAHAIHSMFIFNKILATPPWCLLSAAFTVAVWAVLYWVIDVRGSFRWASWLEGAGQNALTAYLLAFVLDALLDVFSQVTGLPNLYAALGGHFATGFARAVLLSLAIAWLARRLRGTSLQLAL